MLENKLKVDHELIQKLTLIRQVCFCFHNFQGVIKTSTEIKLHFYAVGEESTLRTFESLPRISKIMSPKT